MIHILLRVGCAIGIVAVFFFSTLATMNHIAPLCPVGKAIALNGPFPPYGTGYAFSAAAPVIDSQADSTIAPAQSKYVMCEDGYALGPAHSVHADIVAKGKGRFSHWTSIGFAFSSSDNSDPNKNGRLYRAVAPP